MLFGGPFWALFGRCLLFFFGACREFFSQHAENCVNTSAFARREPKNIVNTVMFVTRGKKHRKYRGLGLPKRKKTAACTMFFALRVSKNNNPTYVTIFRGPQKCENKMCCKLRYDKNIILCSAPARTRRAHEQHQGSHYHHNPYGIESVRSSTIRTA